MKKLLFFVTTATLMLFSSVSVFGEIKTYIGTMSNQTYNLEAPSVLLLDDDQSKGKLFVVYPLQCSTEAFTVHKTGNKLAFKAGNIEYNLTVSYDGIIGAYIVSILDDGTYNTKKGTCQFSDITGKEKMYTESFYSIMIEAEWNNNKQILQSFFDSFHPTGKARYLKVEKANATFDNDKLLKVKLTCTLYWQGPIQSGQTKFSIECDKILNKWSEPQLIDTSGFTNQDVKELRDSCINGFFQGVLMGLGL